MSSIIALKVICLKQKGNFNVKGFQFLWLIFWLVQRSSSFTSIYEEQNDEMEKLGKNGTKDDRLSNDDYE